MATVGSEEYSLFYGVLDSLRVKVENQTCIVEASIKSESSLMDSDERSRSFQDANLTYTELLQVCE